MAAHWTRRAVGFALWTTSLLLGLFAGRDLHAQTSGTIRGVITSAESSTGVGGGIVSVEGSRISALTDPYGLFTLRNVPQGSQTILVRAMGYATESVAVDVPGGATANVDFQLESAPILLSEIVVEGASRIPELAIEAPAAVSRVSQSLQRDYGPTAQVAQALALTPGVDALQTGLNDWNINTRGFNTTNSRRVLVLMDGRDLSLSFLGSQEWPALSLPLADLGTIELVRGPGSALYGPNAFSGVLNITTPSVREVLGTEVSVIGGELSTMEADVRHARLLGDGRFGLRVHGGYATSDTWARSRTDLGDLAAEYSGILDGEQYPIQPPAPGYEVVPLSGQQKEGAFGLPGAASGDRDPVRRAYGGARLDYYAQGGGTFTTEVGWSRNENESSVTGAGRFQIGRADRPWARVSWDDGSFSAKASYSGRISDDQISLAAGSNTRETSAIFDTEVQYRRSVFGGASRVVLGASARSSSVNSHGTLLAPEYDSRTDGFYSAYGQFEADLRSDLRLLLASRVDKADLFDTQYSPKAALVWSPSERHALRVTVNKAFKTPVIVEQFLSVPAGAPQDLSLLEAGLRASPLGPVLAGVPQGTLFTNTSAVPVLALGNPNLDVERVTTWEVGYKTQLDRHVFMTLDVNYSDLRDFITELLPAVNPTYGLWTAPAAVPEEYRSTVEAAVREGLATVDPAAAAALSRLPDGSTAIVVSVGNAGRARGYGVEFGVGARFPALELDANYSFFDFDVKDGTLVPGQRILPNTPRHKMAVTIGYAPVEDLEVRASGRFSSAFDWSGGIWSGRIPAQQIFDLILGYQLTGTTRLQLTTTNVFDQRYYQVFGGPVIGRRVLAGLTATF